MKNLKCENCGANLKFNRTTNMYYCENCGSEFLINDSNKLQNHFLSAGFDFLDLKEYKKATESFNKACEISPKNANCWFGKIKAITKNFNSVHYKDINEIETCLNHIQNTATKDEMKLFDDDLKQLEINLATLKKEVKNYNKFQKFLFWGQIIIFGILLIINFIFTLNSDSKTIWKIVGFIIICIYECISFSITATIAPHLKFDNKKQSILSLILFIAIIAIIICIDFVIVQQI